MGRVTDQERSEVARRLRACKSHIDAAGWFWLNDELGGVHVVASSEERLRRGTALLADLIEPSCDCDAPEALADEMDAYTCCPDDDRCGKRMPPSTVHGFARRIREALGVEVR